MSKFSTYAATLLFALPVLAAVLLYVSAPMDQHYGSFPRLVAGAYGLVAMVPASVWLGITHVRSGAGKALLGILGGTAIGFFTLNLLIGGFGPQVLSILLLSLGLLASMPITLTLLSRSWRNLRRASSSKEKPNSEGRVMR